ncbi:MAG: c-type cytochrome [Burkholderiales bacterium]|nr:c-type cytochrome [Burkholderiales bacterium]
MIKDASFRTALRLVAAVAVASLAQVAHADVDKDAAMATLRQNNCLKCHGLEKAKDGPAYAEVAKKYKGKADAEAKIAKHLTTGEKAKFPDGHEEDHKIIKVANDAELKNLIAFILSR